MIARPSGSLTPSRARQALALVAVALAALAGCSGTGTAPASGAAAPLAVARAIVLPELLAIEMPAPGMREIAPGASPLRELLEAGSADGLRVTHDQTAPLTLGATRVTWTAWSGEPGASGTELNRQAWVYILPFGQTPVGVTGKHNATAGNHAPKVVRDASGAVHVAWLDADRPGKGATVRYRRGALDPATGRFTWDSAPIPVSADPAATGFLAVGASAKGVHVAWTSHGSTLYRRLVRAEGAWRWEPIRSTGATGASGDNGPDIAVRGDDEIHLLTYGGAYALSTNGGLRWRVEQVPWPRGGEKKNPALAVDPQGNAHVVFTLKVRSPASWSGGRPSGGYWQLRYMRREAQGGWVDAQDVLAAFSEWNDRGASQDTLADWADIAVDGRGSIHLAWHGTANSGIYGRDEPFYSRRVTAGPGAWGPWEPPQPLHPHDRRTRLSYAFAPSLALDEEADALVAVTFFEHLDLPREVFDSDALAVRGGRVAGPPLPLSRMARTALDAGRPGDALSTWFPTAAPRLHHDARGRVWLDVLHTAETPESHRSPHLVIYQRLDVTEALRLR